jgi:hypothetical protein
MLPQAAFCKRVNVSLPQVPIDTLYEELGRHFRMKPQYTVSNELLQKLPLDSQVYLHAAIMPPHKQDCYFMVTKKGINIFYTVPMIQPREESIRAPPLPPEAPKVRVFRKGRSVFKNWREDTPKTLLAIRDYDFKKSKLGNMLKSQIERTAVADLLLEHLSRLKEEFLSLIVFSIYPNISWLDFTAYSREHSVVGPTCSLSDIDRLFVAVNADLGAPTPAGVNPDRALCRYEFLEILVRIASVKYREPKIVSGYADALSLLFQYMFPDKNVHPIQDFRRSHVWILPVDDLLQANRTGLLHVFHDIAGVHKEYILLEAAVQLIVRKCGFQLTEQQVTQAFAFSKMSIICELEEICKGIGLRSSTLPTVGVCRVLGVLGEDRRFRIPGSSPPQTHHRPQTRQPPHSSLRHLRHHEIATPHPRR